jgi:hypothetical protein
VLAGRRSGDLPRDESIPAEFDHLCLYPLLGRLDALGQYYRATCKQASSGQQQLCIP